LAANAGPITFDGSSEKFNAQTTDGNLIGTTKKYGLKSELTDYQLANVAGAPTTTIEGDVNFINPCLKPFTFVNSMLQDNTKNDLEDNYSDNDPIEFTLNEFSITPARCTLNYACVKVQFQAPSASDWSDTSDV
jgi:hypothetical protein